ncbi:hypothetical protein V8C43DRAFT_320611 [Trichoderma afarasin]
MREGFLLMLLTGIVVGGHISATMMVGFYGTSLACRCSGEEDGKEEEDEEEEEEDDSEDDDDSNGGDEDEGGSGCRSFGGGNSTKTSVILGHFASLSSWSRCLSLASPREEGFDVSGRALQDLDCKESQRQYTSCHTRYVINLLVPAIWQVSVQFVHVTAMEDKRMAKSEIWEVISYWASASLSGGT